MHSLKKILAIQVYSLAQERNKSVESIKTPIVSKIQFVYKLKQYIIIMIQFVRTKILISTSFFDFVRTKWGSERMCAHDCPDCLPGYG